MWNLWKMSARELCHLSIFNLNMYNVIKSPFWLSAHGLSCEVYKLMYCFWKKKKSIYLSLFFALCWEKLQMVKFYTHSISSHFDVCNKCLPKYRSFKYNYLLGNLHIQYGTLFINAFSCFMYKKIKPTKWKVSKFLVIS